MTKEQMQKFLTMLNVQDATSKYIQIPEITTIGLSNHGDMKVNPLVDFLKFDMDNELIKVKQYEYTAVSSRFANWKVSGKTITTTLVSNYKNSIFPFRSPKVSDIVFFVNLKTNAKVEKTFQIKSIEREAFEIKFTLDADVSSYSPDEFIACYADFEAYTNGLTLSHFNDVSLLIHYTPVSNYETDVYIDFDSVPNFGMKTRLIGF